MNKKSFLLNQVIILIVSCVLIISCDKNKNLITLNNVSYHVPINDPYGYGVWWKMNIEESKRSVFTKNIFESAISGDISVYDSVYQPLSLEQVKEKHIATVVYEKVNSNTLEEYDSVALNNISHNEISELHYKENWQIDTVSFEISKTVESFCPTFSKLLYMTEEGGQFINGDLYWFNSQKNKGKKTILTDLISYDIHFVRYHESLKGIAYSDMYKFEEYAKKLIQAAFSNKIKAYDFFPGEISNNLIEGTELKELLSRDILVHITNPETLEGYDSTYVQDLDPKDITGFRFLEEWHVNTKTMEIEKKVLGICPLESVLTDYGTLKGVKPLFWIYFDKKNPEEIKKKFGL